MVCVKVTLKICARLKLKSTIIEACNKRRPCQCESVPALPRERLASWTGEGIQEG